MYILQLYTMHTVSDIWRDLRKSVNILISTAYEFCYDSHEDSNIQDGIQLLWYIFYNSRNEYFYRFIRDQIHFVHVYFSIQNGILLLLLLVCERSCHPDVHSRIAKKICREKNEHKHSLDNITITTGHTINKNILWFIWSGSGYFPPLKIYNSFLFTPYMVCVCVRDIRLELSACVCHENSLTEMVHRMWTSLTAVGKRNAVSDLRCVEFRFLLQANWCVMCVSECVCVCVVNVKIANSEMEWKRRGSKRPILRLTAIEKYIVET